MFRVPLSRIAPSGTCRTCRVGPVDRHVGEHLGLQLPLRVVELDAHLHGPRLLVDGGVDVRDGAVPDAPGPVRKRHGRLLPEGEARQLVLVDVREHPDVREVEDVEERVGRRHLHAVVRRAGRHVPRDRRVDRQGADRLAVLLDPLDVGGRDLPEEQALARRGEQVPAALRGGRDARRAERLRRLEREEVLLLGRVELGAVEEREDLTLLDVLAGEVGGHVLDVGVVPRVDVVDPRLVGGDAARRPDRGRERRPCDDDGLEPEETLPCGRRWSRWRGPRVPRLPPCLGQ